VQDEVCLLPVEASPSEDLAGLDEQHLLVRRVEEVRAELVGEQPPSGHRPIVPATPGRRTPTVRPGIRRPVISLGWSGRERGPEMPPRTGRNVRESLVEVALEQFHARGFTATGVKDITDAAGVPKGSFYNHFDSKETLGAEVVRRYAAARGAELLVDPDVAPLDRVRGHFRSLAAALHQGAYQRGCMFGNLATELSDHSEPIRAEVESGLDAWSELVAQDLAEARTSGDLQSPMADAALARFLVSAWQGAVLRAKVSHDSRPIDDFFTALDTLTA
jgi:TetR/AcrR family transcriptional repressor of nem operon